MVLTALAVGFADNAPGLTPRAVLDYCLDFVTDVELPTEFVSTTVTLPIAVLSPLTEIGMSRFWNMLPTSCEADEL